MIDDAHVTFFRQRRFERQDVNRRGQSSRWIALALLGLALTAGGCVSISFSDAPKQNQFIAPQDYIALQEKFKSTLSESVRTEHFDIFSQPGSVAAKHAHRIGIAAERELARICTQLEVENDVRYTLFLFENEGAVSKTLGKRMGVPVEGLSAGRTSFLPYGNAPTRIHEMVHLVAAEKIGGHPPTRFFEEGLANALLDSVPHWDVHAVAKHYRKKGKLPRLAEITGALDFYAWMQHHPGLNAYDIAGSWMKFLLDTQGAAKTKRYYMGQTAEAAFATPLDRLEQAWLATLDDHPLTPEWKRGWNSVTLPRLVG